MPVLVNPSRFATPGGGGPSYATALTTFGGLTSRLKLDETSGTTAVDELGVASGSYVSSPTLGVTGLVNDGGTAVQTGVGYINAPGGNDPTAKSMIFWWKAVGGGTPTIWGNTGTTSSNRSDFDIITGSSLNLRVRGTNHTVNVSGGINLLDAAKHFFIITSDSTTWEVFVDGASQGTFAQATALATAFNGNLNFGRHPSLGVFAGVHDDIAFSSNKATSTDAANLYSAGL